MSTLKKNDTDNGCVRFVIDDACMRQGFAVLTHQRYLLPSTKATHVVLLGHDRRCHDLFSWFVVEVAVAAMLLSFL